MVASRLRRRHLPGRQDGQSQAGDVVLAVRRGDRCPPRDPAQPVVTVTEHAARDVAGVDAGVRGVRSVRRSGRQRTVAGSGRQGRTGGGGGRTHLAVPVHQLPGAPSSVHRWSSDLFGDDKQESAFLRVLIPSQVTRLILVLVLLAARNGDGHPGEEQQPRCATAGSDHPGRDVAGIGPRQILRIHPGQRHLFPTGRQRFAGARVEQHTARRRVPGREKGPQNCRRFAAAGGCGRRRRAAHSPGTCVDGGPDRAGGILGDLAFRVAQGLGHILFVNGAETESG